MNYLLYSFGLAIAMLLSLPYWVYQVLRHGKYRTGFWERIGRVPRRLTADSGTRRIIWIHAVSVGEVLGIAALVEKLGISVPSRRIIVSTTTDTGQKLARQRFGAENVFYFPIDFAFAIRPYLRALRPELFVLAETEFWPNFLRLARGTGARVAVVNARISDRSWPNYLRFRWALSHILRNIDLFLAQTEEDASRLRTIGAEPARVQVTGNLKFDVSLPAPPAILANLRNYFSDNGIGPVLICGSTVEGEEPLLLKAFDNIRVQHTRAVMILAPRHPERFDEVASLLQNLQIPYHRRSTWAGEELAGGVLLLDSIGELAALYGLADVAFVGGSLVPRGGHNIIEPAQHGVAIVVGNHMENFRDMVTLFQSRGAVRVVTMAELPLVLVGLLANDAERQALGRRAQEALRSQSGATERTVHALKPLLSASDGEFRSAISN